MRGRQVFFETLLAHGVDRIFGNPGTTESPLLDYPQLQYIVHLHEGVAVAPQFYAQRRQDRFVNLHVAPGLATASADLQRAQEQLALVVTAGQQDTRIGCAPRAGADLAAMARLSQVDRAGRECRRARPILQRAFRSPTMRRPARCRGLPSTSWTGDQGAGCQARAGLHGEPSRSRRHRGDVALIIAAKIRDRGRDDVARTVRQTLRSGRAHRRFGWFEACAAAILPDGSSGLSRHARLRRAGSPSSSHRKTWCCWSAVRSSRKSGTAPARRSRPAARCCRSKPRRRAWPTTSRSMPA